MKSEDFLKNQEAHWSKITSDLSNNNKFLLSMDYLLYALYFLIFITPILSVSVYLLQILNEKI